MADVYQIKYSQSVNVAGTSTTMYYQLTTDEVVKKSTSLNTAWSNGGIYAGGNPGNGSMLGGYTDIRFTGYRVDRVNSDMKPFTLASTQTTGTQNLRFMIRYSRGAQDNYRNSYKWTGISEDLANQYNALTDSSADYQLSVYDPFIRNDKNVNMNQQTSTPFMLAPLNGIKINELIFVPYFSIREIEYYNYDSVNDCYKSTATNQTDFIGVRTWSQVKNEDKTPEGTYYDPDLFSVGWKEIDAVNEDGRRFQYVNGVYLVPYYGKCSNTYDPSNDSYSAGINPDDGNTYGTRNILGALASDSGTYPTTNNFTDFSRPCLMVFTENYNSNLQAITYSNLPGVVFSNAAPNDAINDNVFSLDNSTFAPTSNSQILNTDGQWNNIYGAVPNGGCLYKIYSAEDDEEDPSLTVLDTQLNGTYPGVEYTSLTSGNSYFLIGDGPVANQITKSTRVTRFAICNFFSIDSLWHTIASLGCYVADFATTARFAPLGVYIGDNNSVYCGEMTSSGVTTGNMIQGKDVTNLPQVKIDDIIAGTPYTPVIPSPGGGDGGSDPSSTPLPSGKGESKITGDGTKGAKTREFGNGSITYYALSVTNSAEFKNLLWAQPKSFYNAIQISGKQNASIFDYVSSYRYYPTDVTSFGISLGAASDIHLGTGASFKQVDGTEYKLQPLSNFYSQFSWCRWSLSSFSGWRHNFLDYSPYCKLSIYLPYAGTYDLDVQTVAAMIDITQATINVDVCIDINTGSLTYYVDADGVLILDKTLKLGVDLPLSGNDSIQQSAAILQSNYHNGSQIIGEATSLASSSSDVLSAVAAIARLPFKLGEMALSSSLASRQIPTQVGGFGGTLSTVTMGQDPYITIYRQKIANPENYGHVVGYLTKSKHQISELTGWTICTNPDLSGIVATTAELNMITQILQTGFYA